jgi:isopentenyldiphosphate isomerase
MELPLPLAAHELVDVIDDAGNTVGVVTRREMRLGRLPHRCTYVLVFNSKGQLFIHLRTPIKDVYPSHWDICVGGVLAAGETFDEGVLREIKEEIGVETEVEKLFPFAFSDERTIVQGMVYKAVHDGPFVYQPEEVVRGEFVSIEEALRRAETEPFCPDGVEVLKRYLGQPGHMP